MTISNENRTKNENNNVFPVAANNAKRTEPKTYWKMPKTNLVLSIFWQHIITQSKAKLKASHGIIFLSWTPCIGDTVRSEANCVSVDYDYTLILVALSLSVHFWTPNMNCLRVHKSKQ